MKKSKMKVLTIVLCIAFAALALTACGDDVDDAIDDPDPIEKTEEVAVKLYYANLDYVNTGTETAESPMMLPAYDSKLMLEKDDKKEVYEKTLDLLNLEPGDNYLTVVTDNIDFENIMIRDKTCIVNLDSENLLGGAMDEAIFINQIVSTLCASFSDIKQVQFQVNGLTVDSLMGQIDATLPFEMGENGKAVQVK